MTDARALLNRITAFRERLEEMPRLLPDKDVHPVPNVASKEIAAVEAKAASPDLPVDLGTRVRKCLDDARSLIAGLNELGQCVSVRESEVLRGHHADTASLLDGSVRMLRHYPEDAEARWNWNTSLEVALRSVRQRLRELKLVADREERDRARIDRLAEMLRKLHVGEKLDREAFDTFALEVAADFKSGPMLWSGGTADRSNLVRSVAAHSLDVARIVARLAPAPVPAALLCDVGMPAVNATDVEAHVLLGVEMLRRQFPDAGDWIEAVEHHHERVDGSGFPHGWDGDRVSYAAKLLAVADAYTRRVTGWPTGTEQEPRTVLADLLLDAEKGVFDTVAVQALLAIGFHPVGSVVELGDGSIAGVAAGPRDGGNPKLFAKPVVQLLLDVDGEPVSGYEGIDLETAGGTVVRTVPRAERAAKLALHHLSWAV